MNIVYNIIAAIGCLVVGYLIGSISISISIGKGVYHQDPRDYGSGNAGGTNASRLWGRRVGAIVVILDMAKTLIPLWACWAILAFIKVDGTTIMASAREMLNGETAGHIIEWPVYWLCLLGAEIGHVYPVYYNFRGGKGVANYLGGLAGTNWALFIVSGVSFMSALGAKRYISLGSIVSAIVGIVFTWTWAILLLTVDMGNWGLFGTWGITMYCNWVYAIIITLMGGLLLLKHRSNIKRIQRGEEEKVTWL